PWFVVFRIRDCPAREPRKRRETMTRPQIRIFAPTWLRSGVLGETVFDPFLGSGTTPKVARELGRKGIGYEIDLELKDVIRKKLGLYYHRWTGEDYSLEEKTGARNLRKTLQTKVHQQKSVAS